MWTSKGFFHEHIFAATFDREIDFSYPQGSPKLSENQYKFLSSYFKIDGFDIINLLQIHGDDICDVDQCFLQSQNVIEADGVICNKANVPLLIRTADCLPIFIYEEKSQTIGLLHAGWRGTHKEILRKALEKIKGFLGVKIEDIKIAFGPAIRKCCYEVQNDFIDKFPEDITIKDGSIFLDLISCNKKQALSEGVLLNNIYDSEICSCCDKNYFSYRREGKKSGRNLSVIIRIKD